MIENTSPGGGEEVEGRKLASRYPTELRAYAQAEYDARKASYQAAIDASLPYMQQLAKLQVDKETVEAGARLWTGWRKSAA